MATSSRSSRSSTTASTCPSPKTKKSDSENQERAYVAASRRTDRSLDARLRSAHKASDIHELRTGKRLQITEQVIIDEEMYEEVDDGLRRSYHALRLNPNASPEEVDRHLDILAAHVSLQSDSAWRVNGINSMFAQAFPHAAAQAQILMRRYAAVDDEHAAHNHHQHHKHQQQYHRYRDPATAPEHSPDQDAAMFDPPTEESSHSPPPQCYLPTDLAMFGVDEARRHDQPALHDDASLAMMLADDLQDALGALQTQQHPVVDEGYNNFIDPSVLGLCAPPLAA